MPGGDDLELVQGGLAPFEEAVPLAVARILQLDVAVPGVRAAEDVGDDGMVGDELGRDHRVHRLRVSSQAGQRVAHGGEVDQGGHPVGVVQEHPRRVQVDLVTALGGGIPPPHRLDLLGRDHLPVLVPQQVLQQHLEGERQVVHAQPVQPVQLPPATAEHHRITGLQAIHGPPISSRPHRGEGHPVTSVTYAAMDFSPRARAAATR